MSTRVFASRPDRSSRAWRAGLPALAGALCATAVATAQPAAPLIRGADVSLLPRVEAGGGRFRDGAGTRDAIAILHDHGVDTIRLRLWHAPADGRSGLPEALALAARARAAGCRLLLDLHYSDTWADPGRQAPPAAWAGLGFAALAESVRACTRDVLAALAARDAAPAIVQVGNEITAGLLWDAGRVGGAFDTPAQWDRLAALLRAAGAGIDEALPGARRPQVMLHLDRGGDNAGARRFLDAVTARGVAFDLIGLSYYPWWHGTLADLGANLRDLAARYGRDVMVVETGYPWTLAWADGEHNVVGDPGQLLPGFPATPAGQRAFLAALLDTVRAVPEGRGRGVCWWAPEWIAAPGHGSPWENVALFDTSGAALPALDAFAGGR